MGRAGAEECPEVESEEEFRAAGTDCASYAPRGTRPDLRGLMTWSISWDRWNEWEFADTFDGSFGRG